MAPFFRPLSSTPEDDGGAPCTAPLSLAIGDPLCGCRASYRLTASNLCVERLRLQGARFPKAPTAFIHLAQRVDGFLTLRRVERGRTEQYRCPECLSEVRSPATSRRGNHGGA